MKIAVVGAGYVGLAHAVTLARLHEVWIVDTDAAKVAAVSRGRSPFADEDIADYLARPHVNLHATRIGADAYCAADFVMVATPTNYDARARHLDTSCVESVIADALAVNPDATIVINSTVPLGFTRRMRARHQGATIIYAPEFLREGRALHDRLHPTRVVIGSDTPQGRTLGKLLAEGATDAQVPVLMAGATEAEAIKLLANSYLAMRVAYFNEVDTFAARHHLSTARILDGICLDPRIGAHYNNPSFGFGGYCLPKDTEQLRAHCRDVPQRLLGDVGEANEIRKDFVADDIAQRDPAVVGIYRLAMKSHSDNFREAAVLGVMARLVARGIAVIVYEPQLAAPRFGDYDVVVDLDEFKRRSDLIVTNRRADALDDVSAKVYTRDVYGTY